jgi:hypothetical protein
MQDVESAVVLPKSEISSPDKSEAGDASLLGETPPAYRLKVATLKGDASV